MNSPKASFWCRGSAELPRAGAVALALALVPAAVEAGSIFMKNGYILQGPIVESDDDAVVLGWDNGKVTVHRRFIEEVSFDPGEKQRIEEQRRLVALELQRSEQEEVVAVTEEIEDLPADLEVFLELYSEEGPNGQNPLGGASVAVDGGSFGVPVDGPDGAGDDVDDVDDGTGSGSSDASGLETTPGWVEGEDAALAERLQPEGASFSLRPPSGWTLRKVDEGFVAVGAEGASGEVPSFNVVELPVGDLNLERRIELLKEEQEAALADYEVLAEGAVALDEGTDLRAYEVIARGALDGRTRVLRQVIVARGESLWLFSGFTTGLADDGAFEAIRQSLATFRPERTSRFPAE